MSPPTAETIARLRSFPHERTPQRLDPLGVQAAWTLVPILGVLGVGYALYSTLIHSDQIRHPSLAIAGILLAAVAAAIAAVRTHPGLAPFGRWSHLSIVGTTLVGGCLFTASVWGANHRIQDDWGQVAVGLLLLAMPLYRPVGEVIGVAVVCALTFGTLAAFQSSLVIHNAPVVYGTVAATPVLVLAAGGAGYAWTMTHQALRWRSIAMEGQRRLDAELRQAAERMIAQEKVTALNREAAPFLSGLLAKDSVDDADRERASLIAAELRRLALVALDRSWLSEIVDRAIVRRSGRKAAPVDRVDDPDHLERVLNDDQRGIVGALIEAVVHLPGLDPASVRIVATEPTHPRFVLTARAAESRSQLRRELVPYLSALRSTSMTTAMRVADGRLEVRFAYPWTERR